MNSLPRIQSTPQSTNSAIGDKSDGWLFTIVAMCCVLLVTLSLIFRYFQPSTEQIALFLG
jgi:hypothetical protein